MGPFILLLVVVFGLCYAATWITGRIESRDTDASTANAERLDTFLNTATAIRNRQAYDAMGARR